MNPIHDSSRSPGTRKVTWESVRRQQPVEFYRAPGIQVTGRVFAIAGRCFPVEQLSRLQVVRGPRDPLMFRIVVATGVVLAGIGLALGYAGGPTRLTAATYLTLAAAVVLPLLLAVIGNWLRPPSYELWGRYQGVDVLLFSCDQERQFGQVTRALVRAREVSELGALTEPVAAQGWVVHR